MSRLILVFVLLLSNAESKPTAVLKKSIEDFHLNLYKSVIATKPDDNIFFSPYSISLALTMVTGGARGKTEKELLNLLQIPSRDKLDPSVKQLMNITRLPEIKLANRIYPDAKFPILPAFKQRLQKLYNITLVSVDLNAKNVTPVIDDINAWVFNQTNGYIKTALNKNDLARNKSSTVNALLIINCLLFDGTFFFFSNIFSLDLFLAKWRREFEGQHTKDGKTFYPDIGPPQEKKLTLMMQNDFFPYVDLTSKIGARMIHLPFENKDLTFTIILPNKDIKLSQVESNLTSALLNSPTTTNQNVFLWIPKWKFEFESNLENVLKTKMKVNDIFSESNANLKGLSMKKNIFLSNLIHKYVHLSN
jgi:serpin B